MREHVDQLGGHRILVIGDLILDRTVTGTVDRISPEAPVPVVSMPTTTHALGGAANVAAGVRALGSTPLLAGVTGDDDERVTMLGLLETAGIGRELIGVLPDRPTTLKTRIRAGAQQIARVDFEDRTDVDPKLVLARASDAFAAGVDAVILSDYAKGVLSDTVVTSVLADAFERGVPTIVDPKHTSPHRYARATLVTPNLAELRTWVDDDLDRNDLMAIGTAASAIAAEVSIEWVVVTMGQDGLLVCAPDGSHHHVPARPIAVFDVTGAGDSVAATLGTGVAGGLTPLAAAELANRAGAIAVSRRGAAVVGLTDLRAEFVTNSSDRVLDRDQLFARVDSWRREERRIVFTNGCFDLLHAGHLAVLQACRDEGDIVIVGINSDASVRRLKGDARPLAAVTDRAALLAELRCVDAVVIFEEDDPGTLVESIQPDVIAKGGDYRPDEIIGGATVEARGGKILIVPTLEGYSTTSLIDDAAR